MNLFYFLYLSQLVDGLGSIITKMSSTLSSSAINEILQSNRGTKENVESRIDNKQQELNVDENSKEILEKVCTKQI